MNVVLDANMVAAIFLPLPYSGRVSQQMSLWRAVEADLFAPVLLDYEISSVLRKAVVSALITGPEATEILKHISALAISRISPTVELQNSAICWAERLRHAATYDAHYLAVAEHCQAELWTADRRLAHAARQAGFPGIRWIGDSDAP